MINGRAGGETLLPSIGVVQTADFGRFEGGRSSYEEHSVEKQFGSESKSNLHLPSFKSG